MARQAIGGPFSGTAEEAAEKIGKADPSATKVASG